jgi:hypothetical protein
MPYIRAYRVRINKSRMLPCIVLPCGYHYLSMFLTISQPPDLTTEPATWYFNITQMPNLRAYGYKRNDFYGAW